MGDKHLQRRECRQENNVVVVGDDWTEYNMADGRRKRKRGEKIPVEEAIRG